MNKRFLKNNHFLLFSILCLLLRGQVVSAEQNSKIRDIQLLNKNTTDYVEFFSDDMKSFVNPAKGNRYPSINLFDNNLRTCWVAGSVKKSKKRALYIKVPDKIDIGKIIVNIFSGYGKSKKLFKANARPRRINISVYAAFQPDGFSSEVAEFYIIKKHPTIKKIKLDDIFGIQSFPLNLDKKALLMFQTKALSEARNYSSPNFADVPKEIKQKTEPSFFILRFNITDVYKGSKYDDICISELFFNDKFITFSRKKYSSINDVYIKNDNTLLAEFKRKKIVVYSDNLATFTYVDWLKKSPLAILHYVKNDAVGAGSRTEELYSLIDIKNKQVVNTEFEKCTGVATMFCSLDKDEGGNIYIVKDDFKIKIK